MITKEQIEDCIKQDKSNITDLVKNISGMSNLNNRNLINNLCNIEELNYAEVGTFLGSWLCAAICNTKIKLATCLDYYSYFDKINNSTLGAANKSKLQENINNTPHACQVNIIDENAFDYDFSTIKDKFDIFFYDGPHGTNESELILEKAYPILNNDFLLIIDDYDDIAQKKGVELFIKSKNIKITYQKILPGNTYSIDEQDNSGYYNGLLIAICQK